jgi:hypothetical protein
MLAALIIGHHFSISALWNAAGDPANPDAAIRASDVLDDPGLTERQPKAFSHHAPDYICRTASGVRYQRDLPHRVCCLRLRDRRYGRQRGSTGCQMQKLTASKLHGGTVATRESATQ